MKGLIFTYLLTFGGAFFAILNPYVGFLIYICFAIIKPDSMWAWAMPPGRYSLIIGLAMIIGWLLQGLGKWNFGKSLPILSCLLGFWSWSLLSALISATNQQVAWVFVTQTAKFVFPFLIGLTLIDSIRKLKQLAWVIVLSQGYVAYELNLLYLVEEFNKSHAQGFGGLDNNGLALTMVTGAGIAFFMGLETQKLLPKLLAYVFALLMVHVVMLSFSRGGMLGLCITGIFTFLLTPKRPKHVVALVLAFVIGSILAGPQVRERFMSVFVDPEERDESSTSRIELWSDGLILMGEHPIFGVGPNHWKVYASPRFGWPPGKAMHSLWVQMGAELGVPGLFFLAMFYGYCCFRLWSLPRGKSFDTADTYTLMGNMVIVSVFSFAVSAQFISVHGVELPYYVVLVGAGLLKLRSIEDEESVPVEEAMF